MGAVRKLARKWNPSLHPRDSRGRFTRSSTRVLKGSDSRRARSALSGFSPAKIGAEADARAWIESRTGKPLSPDSPLSRYLAGGWRETNKAIRADKTPPPEVAEIDAEFGDLPEDVMLRRQVPLQMFAHIPVKDLEGMKVRDAAYASTSLDLPDAGPSAADAVTMHIAAAAGTLAYVNGPDGEILLARDTEIAITRAEPNGRGGWDLYGAVIPKTAVKRDRRAGGDQGDGEQTPDAPAADGADGGSDTDGRSSGTSGRGRAEDSPRAAAAPGADQQTGERTPAAGTPTPDDVEARRAALVRDLAAAQRRRDNARIDAINAELDALDSPSQQARDRQMLAGVAANMRNARQNGPRTPDDAGEPGPLPDDGPLGELTRIDRERIRVAVEDHAARYYRSPLTGGSKEDAARYVSEGPLGKLTDREGLSRVWKAVAQVLDDRPELLTRTPEESERAAAARTERVEAMASQAAKAMKAGDFDGALELIDQAEQIAPDHRTGKPTPHRSWDDLRGIVRRRAEQTRPAGDGAAEPAGGPAADGDQIDAPTTTEGGPWIAPSTGALAELAPADRERARIAVEDNAGRIYRTPMMGGSVGNVARYVAEGRDLVDVSNRYGFRKTVDAVAQILTDRPDLMHRTDDEVGAGVEARRADATARAEAAGADMSAGDFTAARAEIDRGEAIAPDFSLDLGGPPLTWAAMRRIVDDAEREHQGGDGDKTGDGTPAAGTSAPAGPVTPRQAQAAAARLGDVETERIVGPGGINSASPGQLAELVRAADALPGGRAPAAGTRAPRAGRRGAAVPEGTRLDAAAGGFTPPAEPNITGRETFDELRGLMGPAGEHLARIEQHLKFHEQKPGRGYYSDAIRTAAQQARAADDSLFRSVGDPGIVQQKAGTVFAALRAIDTIARARDRRANLPRSAGPDPANNPDDAVLAIEDVLKSRGLETSDKQMLEVAAQAIEGGVPIEAATAMVKQLADKPRTGAAAGSTARRLRDLHATLTGQDAGPAGPRAVTDLERDQYVTVAGRQPGTNNARTATGYVAAATRLDGAGGYMVTLSEYPGAHGQRESIVTDGAALATPATPPANPKVVLWKNARTGRAVHNPAQAAIVRKEVVRDTAREETVRAALAGQGAQQNPAAPRTGDETPAAGTRVSVDDLIAARESLAASVASGVRGREDLGGGSTAKVELVTFNDGTPAVHKRTVTVGRDAAEQQDAEELGALLLAAAGVRAAAIHRDGPRDIYAQYIDGRVGMEEWEVGPESGRAFSARVAASDDGRLMGLADLVMGNIDRNAGNYIIGEGGELVGIDHGHGFEYLDDDPFLFYGEMSSHFLTYENERATGWADHDISPADIDTFRARLAALRPEFERLGGGDWHDTAMARLDSIGEHATGTRDRITRTDRDRELLAAAPAPAAEAPARTGIEQVTTGAGEVIGAVRRKPGGTTWEFVAGDGSEVSVLTGAGATRTSMGHPNRDAAVAALRRYAAETAAETTAQPLYRVERHTGGWAVIGRSGAVMATHRRKRDAEADRDQRIADRAAFDARHGEQTGERVSAAAASAPDTYDARRARLAAGVESDIATRKRVGGGNVAKGVELVTFNDGTRAIYKVTRDDRDRFPARSAQEQQDAEELGAAVAAAVGAPIPAVHRTGPDEVYVEYVDGRVAMGVVGADEETQHVDSDAGRLLGFADLLMSNPDRHHGNWMVDTDGRLVGIDHGMAFTPSPGRGPAQPSAGYSQTFTEHFIRWNSQGFSEGWADNDLTPADMAEARRRIEALRPEFERLGHTDWHDFALARLDALAPHARGDRNLIAAGDDTGASAPAAGTRAPAAPAQPEAYGADGYRLAPDDEVRLEGVDGTFTVARVYPDGRQVAVVSTTMRPGQPGARRVVDPGKLTQADASGKTDADRRPGTSGGGVPAAPAPTGPDRGPAGPAAAPAPAAAGPAQQLDFMGGATDFVPVSRSAIGLADRPDIGRERAIAQVQQLGLFADESREMGGQMAMLDALLNMPAGDAAAPPPDAPRAPEPDAPAPAAPASIVPDDLSGWNDEQLAELYRQVSSVEDSSQLDEDGMRRIADEWDRREAAMAALIASVPEDLTPLPESEVEALFARLTGELGTMDHPTVDRVGAELDRRQEAERLAAENAPKRALLARPVSELTDDEIELAGRYAADLVDEDALVRVFGEWERRETAERERLERERLEREAREAAEREAALQAAQEAERRAAAEHAAAQWERMIEQMAAAHDAAIVPAYDDVTVLTAGAVLGEKGLRELFGDEHVDRWVDGIEEGRKDARNSAIAAGIKTLSTNDRVRVVTAAADQENAAEFRDWTDAQLHTAASQGVFVADINPDAARLRKLGRRAGREKNRRNVQQLRQENAQQFRQWQIRALADDPRQLSDSELEVAPGLVAAAGGEDVDIPARLDALRAETLRRQATADRIAELKAAGPAAPARYRNPVQEYGWQQRMAASGNSRRDIEARDRLRRAQAAVYGLPEDADTKAIRAAERKDPRPFADQAAAVMAWFRHLGQYEGVDPNDNDWHRGKPDAPDVPDTPDPAPPANVSNPDQVWTQILTNARQEMTDGRYDTARRALLAIARTYRIPADDVEADEASLRRLQEHTSAAVRNDTRTEKQRAADFIGNFRALAAEDGVDPSDTLRYGPPDKATRSPARASWRESTPERERQIDALVARGWDWLEAYAEVHGVDPDRLRAERARSSAGSEKQIRQAYAEWVELQYQAAEAATNGYMLNKRAEATNARRRARGERLTNPRDLFSGPWSTARANASEELLRWWGENPRLTYADFRAQIVGGDAFRSSRERMVKAGKGNQFA